MIGLFLWPLLIGSGVRLRSDETPTHWAYRALRGPDLPSVRAARRTDGPIDCFVQRRLDEQGIEPSPGADRRTLIKRLQYDLLGLLPEPAAVERFVADASPDAYSRLVDRLLASPRFGERWGRHWLDRARYADSDGYEKDRPRPNAWRYRDWVIDAINQDLSFDRFTVEQLAGDLLPGTGDDQRLATAFHRQTLTNTEGGTDQEEFRVAAVFDRVETTGTVWLGLTIGCARCHDHKYDEITQREYFRLFAFFDNGDESSVDVPSSQLALEEFATKRAAHRQKIQELQHRLEARRHALEAAGAKEGVTADAESESIRREIAEVEKAAPKPPMMKVRVISQRTKSPRQTRVLQRGDFLRPGEAVSPGGLAILPGVSARNEARGADRLDFARWLVSDIQPLTPRVAANSVWAHLFGRGLVPTMNDFGVRGERPSHPDLLDWLATEYRPSWSRKDLIRRIVLSRAYRRSSAHRPELSEIDPLNRLLYRQNRFRVEGEIVRDLYLAAGGLLTHRIGGPSVFPPMPGDVAELSYAGNFKWRTSTGADRYRRGLYTFFKRTAPHPNLITFDCPDANTTRVARDLSNTPIQALATLNNDVFFEASQALAGRLLRRERADDHARLTHGFQICAVRPPTDFETERFLDLLKRSRQWYREHEMQAEAFSSRHRPPGVTAPEAAAWVVVCRTLLNLDALITRE